MTSDDYKKYMRILRRNWEGIIDGSANMEMNIALDSKKWAKEELEKRPTKDEQADLIFREAQATDEWLKEYAVRANEREEIPRTRKLDPTNLAPTYEELPELERIRRSQGVPENIEPKPGNVYRYGKEIKKRKGEH